jgi:hypothetical protein
MKLPILRSLLGRVADPAEIRNQKTEIEEIDARNLIVAPG